MALQGFLVRELVSVFWRMELDPFSLECNEVSSSEFWGVYGFGCPPNKTTEEEIGNLPEKEFRIMIVKMIQNLENKIELQINR